MFEPEVIIAIHVYNEEERLPRLLDSLTLQTYSNLKVFISENHSKDKSLEILSRYSRELSMKITTPSKHLNLLENFFFMASELVTFASADAMVFYLGADDYFVHSNSIRELITMQNITGDEIILPRIYVTSPKSSLRAVKSHYKSRRSFPRLIQLVSDPISLGVRVPHSLMSIGAFSYWTRQLSSWRSDKVLARDSFAEYMATWDLVARYSMSFCRNATFVKEINNRKDSSNRVSASINPKSTIQFSRIFQTHHNKNLSTFRFIKQRAQILGDNHNFFLLLSVLSYLRNWISDLNFFFELMRYKFRARKNS